MTSKIFIAANSVSDISEEDYAKAAILVDAAKAFAQSTYQSVFIYDYFRHKCIHVSENLAWLCGEPTDRIMEMGYGFYVKFVPEEERKMLMEIDRKGFEFYEQIPIEKRTEYTLYYDFHIINNQRKRLVHFHFTPMVLAKNGRVWLALCTISLASRKTPGNIIIRRSNSNIYYEYQFQGHMWGEKQMQPLSNTERDVLNLSMQGYTMNEIAKHLCKAVDTIKACKRALFTRLDVSNISEALTVAINYKIL